MNLYLHFIRCLQEQYDSFWTALNDFKHRLQLTCQQRTGWNVFTCRIMMVSKLYACKCIFFYSFELCRHHINFFTVLCFHCLPLLQSHDLDGIIIIIILMLEVGIKTSLASSIVKCRCWWRTNCTSIHSNNLATPIIIHRTCRLALMKKIIQQLHI